MAALVYILKFIAAVLICTALEMWRHADRDGCAVNIITDVFICFGIFWIYDLLVTVIRSVS